MKHKIFLHLLLLPLFSFSETLILSVGEKKTLPLNHHKVLHIGNKDILSVSHHNNQIHLLGKKEGQTFITLGSINKTLLVLNKKTKKNIQHLDHLLKQMKGLSWSVSSKNLIQIEGILYRVYDWFQLANLSKTHNIPYEFKAQLSEGLEKTTLLFFQNLFETTQAPSIQWKQLPLALIPKNKSVEFYQDKLSPFGLKAQKDPFWFSKKTFIEIEIALIETNTSSSSFFGNNLNTKNNLLSFSSLLEFLNLMKVKGQGKTLHHSSILAQDSQEVQIQNGGEIPFSSYNTETKQQSTQWKPYGFHFSLLASLDKKENIEIQIKGQISEPISTPTENKAPPIKKQKIQSTFLVKDKDILKVYQYKKESSGNFTKKGMGYSLPFLNSLIYNNNNYKTSQIIFIQPKILREEK